MKEVTLVEEDYVIKQRVWLQLAIGFSFIYLGKTGILNQTSYLIHYPVLYATNFLQDCLYCYPIDGLPFPEAFNQKKLVHVYITIVKLR